MPRGERVGAPVGRSRRRARGRARTALLAATLAACGGNPAGPVPPGEWGGEGISVTVTSEGAVLEFDCAVGRIEEPLRIEPSGLFGHEGIYTPLPGDPAAGDPPSSRDAFYVGEIDGARMELEVRVAGIDGSRFFHLVRGAPPDLRRCR